MIAPVSFMNMRMQEFKINPPQYVYSKYGTHRVNYTHEIEGFVTRFGTLVATPRMLTHPQDFAEIVQYPLPKTVAVPVVEVKKTLTRPQRK